MDCTFICTNILPSRSLYTVEINVAPDNQEPTPLHHSDHLSHTWASNSSLPTKLMLPRIRKRPQPSLPLSPLPLSAKILRLKLTTIVSITSKRDVLSTSQTLISLCCRETLGATSISRTYTRAKSFVQSRYWIRLRL